MGDMAELAYEQALSDFDIRTTRAMVQDTIASGEWVTKDGEVIPFEEITPRHLANLIRFLERKDNEDFQPLIDHLRSYQ